MDLYELFVHSTNLHVETFRFFDPPSPGEEVVRCVKIRGEMCFYDRSGLGAMKNRCFRVVFRESFCCLIIVVL